LDTLGELAGVFEAADVVFIGGSLVKAGGHNLLEPARCGKPVVFGPHMENFRDAASIFLQAGAAMRVRSGDELLSVVLQLLDDDERRRALGEAARRVVSDGAGATQRILDRLSELLGEKL
ncbi:MAG: 3-deoxy-D-manno-octulosonic acid transferase, partial [Terriglobia bacterium]